MFEFVVVWSFDSCYIQDLGIF